MAQSSVQYQLPKILDQLKNLSSIAAKNNWVFRVNSLDQAIFSPLQIPTGSVLFPVDDEKNIYIDGKSNVNGLFIEYFSTNFIEHETQFKPLLDELKTPVKGTKILNSSSESQKMLSLLEDEIFQEMKITFDDRQTFEMSF